MGMADKIRSSKYTKHKDDLEANEAVGTVTNLSGGEGVEQMPWIDLRLTQKAINYLWDIINAPAVQQTNVKNNLAGNISKSYYIQDNKDIWFYENVLKRCTETMYFKDWNNYYDVHIAKHGSHPKFRLDRFWVNYQKNMNSIHHIIIMGGFLLLCS